MNAKPLQRVWFVSGASSGFGRELVDELMARGDVAVGTFRRPEQVEAFNRVAQGRGLGVLVDVTVREQVNVAVQAALAKFGRIDVLINNAGSAFMGAVEETSAAEMQALLETNFFGPVNLIQAVLPSMRQRRSGHILQISSAAGVHCTVPKLGIYSASKFALEGLSEALALELAPLGIRVLLVEPGPFRTSAMVSAGKAKSTIDDYSSHAPPPRRDASHIQWGDPRKGAQLIIEAVQTPTSSLRLPLGSMAVEYFRKKAKNLMADADTWEASTALTALDT